MAPDTPTYQSSRLTRFLNDLALRPNDPPHDSEEPNFGAAARRASKMAPSISSLSNAANGSLSPSHTHPEADSFAYMETLLESLAVLGQLGTALDTVTQRLPTEIYALVESTLEEVAERSTYTRRGSTFLSVTGKDTGGMSAVFVLTPGESSMVASMGRLKVQPLPASRLRLAALESSSKQADHETLKDLFWTLYSKLDAVTQGLRIVYEVANRIGSVSPGLFIQVMCH
jgi:exocyst complex component 4